MTQYSGLNLKFKQENISTNTVIPTVCLSVFIENKGDATVRVTIDRAKFWLEKGDTLTLPEIGNHNPLLQIGSDLEINFSDTGVKSCSVTKTVAEPTIINY